MALIISTFVGVSSAWASRHTAGATPEQVACTQLHRRAVERESSATGEDEAAPQIAVRCRRVAATEPP